MRIKCSHGILIVMEMKLYTWKIEFILQSAFAIFTEAFVCQTSGDDNVIIGNSYKSSISWKNSAIGGCFIATLLVLMGTGNIQNLWGFR